MLEDRVCLIHYNISSNLLLISTKKSDLLLRSSLLLFRLDLLSVEIHNSQTNLILNGKIGLQILSANY